MSQPQPQGRGCPVCFMVCALVLSACAHQPVPVTAFQTAAVGGCARHTTKN